MDLIEKGDEFKVVGLEGEINKGLKIKINTGDLEELINICIGPVWDGNLINKTTRNRLFEKKLIERSRGLNFITTKGVETLWIVNCLPGLSKSAR